MSPQFIHVVCSVCQNLLFLRLNNITLDVFTIFCLIHSSIDRHLGCFHLLTIVNNSAMNIGVQISIQIPAFSSLGFITRKGIAGSRENSIFNFLGMPYCSP